MLGSVSGETPVLGDCRLIGILAPAKVKRTAERYRTARKAIIALDPTSDVLGCLKPLTQLDIQCPQRQDEIPAPGESRREISWIWLSVSSGSEGVERPLENIQPMSPDDITDCLKAEWSRSRARAQRWTEEQDLVLEEMRRVLAYLQWHANWWDKQGPQRSGSGVTETVQDGLSAYAAKQAAILRHLRRRFVVLWRPRLESFQLGADWVSDVDIVATATDSPLISAVD
ncbi:hypothetical protein BDN71DRAFT_1513112 [Pleurotus eryngii]|uniref:Uncharacterized protein n=1 Tax=Pleurotus eryngii TaxID=5323 RepID=A0A9P5ZJI0_PLEER|nr:hypothetical protein BDN71DRAFT_1513112 [Pleurotus eryngii]